MLEVNDHAFANAHAFARPRNAGEARRMTAAAFGVDRAAGSGELLVAVWREFERNATVGDGVLLGLKSRVVNLADPARLVIDGPCALRGILRVEPGGAIHIGQWCYVGDSTIISSASSVMVGEGTLLAHGVQVFDNSSHPINPQRRQEQFMKMLGDTSISGPFDIATDPIRIGRRCWVGMNSIVMRGVEIGDETIVAAGSVVTKSLPAGVVAAGNPCSVVRELAAEELD